MVHKNIEGKTREQYIYNDNWIVGSKGAYTNVNKLCDKTDPSSRIKRFAMMNSRVYKEQT